MPLPAYLHVGPPKTGTTYIQQLLWQNRAILLEQGILYPADNRFHQFEAASDLVGKSAVWPSQEEVAGRWEALLRLVLAHEGPVVISHEVLAGAEADTVARVVSELADRELHVILTARNARSLHESRFQEGLKNGRDWTFERYLAAAIPSDPTRSLQLGRLTTAMDRWGKAVPPERFHVVTLPGPSAPRTLLFERFSEIIGFDPTGANLVTERVNESLGVVEAELLRRLNGCSGDDLPVAAQVFLKRKVAISLLAGREGQRKLRVHDPKALDALLEQTRLLARRIQQRGYHVVGDLAELEQTQLAMSTADQSEASNEELLDLALKTIRWCALQAAEQAAEHAVQRTELLERIRELRAEGRPPAGVARRAVVSAARRTGLIDPARRLRDRMSSSE